MEHDSRALANNVRRLLDADTREGDWTSQRAEVEKRLEKLEKSINLLEPEDYWCLNSERFEGIEPEYECHWLRAALDYWLGGEDVGSPPTHVVWKAPINGETVTQFSKKVREDAEELRQSEAPLIAGRSDAD